MADFSIMMVAVDLGFTAEREDILTVVSTVAAPDSSLTTIRRVTRTRVSTMAIHRRLIERISRWYRQLRHLPLPPAQCRARLQWFLARSGWNHAYWSLIVFSDEFRFQLCPDDDRRRVWRPQGQHANPAFTTALNLGPQTEVMVMGAISFDSRRVLVVIRGILTAQRYVDCILRTVLLPQPL
ncbi:HTH_Tnp_Tc3_2 domain-containing protein [Trichonephila clavipes]|nr:HTH_Tnp_Tc3_2 domain-containing protein [Trichonephila clavipes]